jgi:hypothetical protein
MGSTGSQKEVNELKRLVISNGFKLVPNGAGHWKLLNKKGAVVIDAKGPVILSGSASDVRARDMHVQRLLAVGALKSDPWKPTKAKTEGEREESKTAHLHSEEARQRRRERELQASRDSQERTRKVRERLEPFVVSIGGWEKKGVKAELARAAFHYLTVTNRVERWATLASAEQNVFTISKGNTVGERVASAWHLFMDEIERAGDTTEARVSRYFELVAQSKGLIGKGKAVHPKPTEDEPAADVIKLPTATPAPRVETAPPPDEGEELAALVRYAGNGYKTPKLALEALALMDTSDEGNRKAAIALAGDILDMEIKALVGGYSGVRVGG